MSTRASGGPTSQQASVFRALLIYRWVALAVPLVSLLLPTAQDAPVPRAFLLLVAVVDNLVPSLLRRQLNALVLRFPVVFGLDLLLAGGLVAASGGPTSPYLLYALSPSLACAFFFGVRGGLLSAAAFAPVLLAAVGLGRHPASSEQTTLVLSELLLLGGAALAFGYLAETLRRLRSTAEDLAQLSDDLRSKNARLERGNRELQAIHELTRAIRDAATVESVQEQLLRILLDRFPCERAIVGLVDPGRQAVTAWLLAGQGAGETSLPHTARVALANTESAVARALVRGKAYCVDGREDPPLADPQLDADLGMGEYAVLPMVCRDGPVGAILVDNPRSGRPITPEVLEGLTRVANQAALALANVRMCVDRAQRIAVMSERQRIAAEMHDAVIQSLFGMALNLQACLGLLDRSPERVRGQLAELRTVALEAVGHLRGTVYDLWSGEFDGPALVAALARQAAEIQRASELKVNVEVRGDAGELNEAAAKTLYRIAQEALANASRYSAAQHASIELSLVDGTAELLVADDGGGFDPATAPAGLGLRTMRERAEAAGGCLRIATQPGQGTRVVATVPCWQLV